jgi:hypothetical protein
MAKKSTSTKTSMAQRDQQKLLREALKRPGVAAAAATYARAHAHTPNVGTPSTKSGYATGGNVA